MLRARTLLVPVATALAAAAFVALRSRSVPDAPRSLSAQHGDPSPAHEPQVDDATLAVARRSAELLTGDVARGGPQQTAPEAAEEAAVAPCAEAWLDGRVRYADDLSPAPGLELELQQGAAADLALTDAEGRFRVALHLGPGVIDVRHRPNAATPHQLRFEPASVTLADDPTSADAREHRTLELWLARPEAMLVVDAVGLDGAAVPGAAVQLELVSVGPTGAERHTLERATTDDRGRAQLALYDLDEVRAAGVVARLEAPAGAPAAPAGAPVAPRLTSALVRLDAPLHAPTLARPLRLVLDVPAMVVVRVADQHGAPLAQSAVLVDDLDPDLRWWIGGVPTTDERGEARAVGLPAGRYRLSLFGAPGTPAQELALVAGERAELDFVVVVPALELAASGHVVDEEGRPLAGCEVTARVVGAAGGPRSVDAATDHDGRFELRALPAERIVVSASAGLVCDEYEPAEVEASFGARDLVFRRTRSVPFEVVVFDVFDASTGRRVRDVLVMTYRAGAQGDYSFHTAEEGRARPRCSVHADTTLMLDAPGYRRRAVLAVDLTATASDGEVPRVSLEPGVLRELRVIDSRGRPIAGAAVSRGATPLGTTDVEGLFVVDLTTWPDAGLAVTAETHAPSTWQPRDGFADLTPAEVMLADLAAPVR